MTCWYQYNTLQGTYQRFNEEALSAPDVPEDYEELSKSYQELKDKQKDTRVVRLSLIHISEPTRLALISYAVFCLKKKKINTITSL